MKKTDSTRNSTIGYKRNILCKIICSIFFLISLLGSWNNMQAAEIALFEKKVKNTLKPLLPTSCSAYEGAIYFDDLNVSDQLGFSSQYLLTDINNKILKLSYTTSFNNVTAGDYIIYSVSYKFGEVISGNKIGNAINDIQASCFDISEGKPIKICVLPECEVKVILTAPIYQDNNTLSVLDDTFTFQATINGFGAQGWIGGGLEGNYNQTILFGPYPVDKEGARFIIQDKINNSCFVSIGSNISSCIYTETCTCCKDMETNSN